jgi:small subunit ribosomal protein S17
MPRNKKEEEVEGTVSDASETEATEDTAVESKADDNAETAEATEDKPKKSAKKKADETEDAAEPNILETVIDTVSTAAETVAGTIAGVVTSGVSSVVSAVTGSSEEDKKRTNNRAEKIGIVQSDKMTKTVTVRVDRLVKHPIYRKYVKRRKKFMAHDELGATIGDKVKIVETRPLSARKRWRVVEIIQKAEK